MFEDVRAQKSHHLESQLRLNEDIIIESLTHIDDTHKIMADYLWKAQGGHKGLEGDTCNFQLHTSFGPAFVEEQPPSEEVAKKAQNMIK